MRERVAKLPKDSAIVIYCGCCPWNKCPTLGAAFGALQALGFSNVKARISPRISGPTGWTRAIRWPQAVRIMPSLRRALGVAAVCACLSLPIMAAGATAEPAGRLNTIAPDFTGTDLSGRPLRLEQFRGRVVLLNFWATWCGPCVDEIPVFSRWQRQYGDARLQVIGVSMDDQEAAVKRFLASVRSLPDPDGGREARQIVWRSLWTAAEFSDRCARQDRLSQRRRSESRDIEVANPKPDRNPLRRRSAVAAPRGLRAYGLRRS